VEKVRWRADDLCRSIDAAHVRHQRRRVGLPVQYMAARLGDLGRRQRGCRHLVQQRLIVLPVDDGDLDRNAP
jgi:hypothetical protein